MFNPPNIQKFKKKYKFSISGLNKNNKLLIGDYAIKAIESGYVNSRQIEAARKAISKHVKKFAKLYIKIKPNLGITKKPAEVRMGKGKGNISDWVYAVKAGKILLELKVKDSSILTETKVKEIFLLGSAKFSIKTKFKK
jgi:large subunit ribosomal protein L16